MKLKELVEMVYAEENFAVVHFYVYISNQTPYLVALF